MAAAVILTKRPTKESLGQHLWQAARHGDVEQLNKYLNEGADVDWQNEELWGSLPLIAAALNNHLHIVEVLLKHGANINLTNRNGNTALHLAATYGRVEVIRLLLARGADINVTTHSNKTPLDKVRQSCYIKDETLRRQIIEFITTEEELRQNETKRQYIEKKRVLHYVQNHQANFEMVSLSAIKRY